MTFNFIPEQPKRAQEVPFYEDANGEGGWAGQGTGKSEQTLEGEIREAVGLLGGMVTNFQRGKFGMGEQARPGCVIEYLIEKGTATFRGRIDVAGLPVRTQDSNYSKNAREKAFERSYRMALFMVRDALKGMFYLQMLSPGYAALMPWLQIGKGNDQRTFTQIWSEEMGVGNLLPAGETFEDDKINENDTVEGEFHEAT